MISQINAKRIINPITRSLIPLSFSMYPSAIDEILVATVESTDFAIEITLLSEFSKLTKYVFLAAKSFVFVMLN